MGLDRYLFSWGFDEKSCLVLFSMRCIFCIYLVNGYRLNDYFFFFEERVRYFRGKVEIGRILVFFVVDGYMVLRLVLYAFGFKCK